MFHSQPNADVDLIANSQIGLARVLLARGESDAADRELTSVETNQSVRSGLREQARALAETAAL